MSDMPEHSSINGGAISSMPLRSYASTVQVALPEKATGAHTLLTYRVLLVSLFVLAGALRSVDVWRPVDGTMREAWREPDVAGIARNYYEEDMNLFVPRIDWRADGPGIVESEFPLFAWCGAVLYHVCGYHEEILRVMSFVLSLAATVYFYRLASLTLPAMGVLISMAVFAVNPLAARLASSVQAEPLMFLAYVGAVYHFVKWSRDQTRFQYWAAMLMTALAILAKAPAAHLGLLFAPVCLQAFGCSAVRRKDVWLFAGVVLAVPLAWYAYAHGIWLEYGNSLGISNESYGRITSLSFIDAVSGTIRGITTTEIDWIWMEFGPILATCAIPLAVRLPDRRVMLYWCFALGVFFVVTGRTTGEGWAAYYHIVSLPVAAMLIGAGATDVWLWCGAVARRCDDSSAWRWLFVPGCRVTVAILLLGTLFTALRVTSADMRPTGYVSLHRCAMQFATHVDSSDLIVASGAEQLDFFGLPSAHNVPYFFFWMHAKGFTLGDEEQSVVRLEEYRRRGARWFVGEHDNLAKVSGFETELRQRYRVVDEHPRAILFDLEGVSANSTLPDQ